MANVVLGAGGSIAAYKACDLTSKLVQRGHRVDVVLTRNATRFVAPLSFAALTHRRVFTDASWGDAAFPHDHLRLTGEADLVVIAPCTANLLGKFAMGLADDIVTTTWLAATCPRLVAPAMNTRMWRQPRVQANVRTLEGDGVGVVGPAEGWLSEDEVGMGRMSEPDAILQAIEAGLNA